METQESGSVDMKVGEWEAREMNGRTPTTNLKLGASAGSSTPRISQAGLMAISGGGPTSTGHLAGTLSKLLFIAHLLAFAILITFLSIDSSLSHSPTFRPSHFYLPLLTSTIFSTLTSLLLLLLPTLLYPSQTLNSLLYISPLLACSFAVLLLSSGSAISLAFAAVALSLAIAQSLYGCWIVPRLPHARRLLSAALPAAGPATPTAVGTSLAVIAALLYSCLWVLGIGGVASAGQTLRFPAAYVAALSLSLAWTMQVARSVVFVAVSRAAHGRLVTGAEVSAGEAFRDTCGGRAFGDVCLGALVAPVLETVRASAQGMALVAGGGDADEFLFSCASCFSGVADHAVGWGNRWGFVCVGAHGTGLVRGSRDAWEMLIGRGMGRLVDADVTGVFCFFCGVAGGAASALLGGSWVLALGKSYATGIAAYSFLIGYFMFRIAMAWPQACVAAYHVAYAESPMNPNLDSVIADRIRELQSFPD